MKTIFSLFLYGIFMILSYTSYAQYFSVSGYIKNYSTDKAIVDASIFEANSGIGTISNSKGYYKLLLKPGVQHILISHSDFESKDTNFELKADTVITVVLKPENLPAKKSIVSSKQLTEKESIESTSFNIFTIQ